MRHIAASLFLAFVIFLSCNTSKTSGDLLSTDNLSLQEYTIDTNRDTVLVTKNGALIKIPHGSISSDESKVTLEIKEAYTIDQIIQGGLLTQSNGQPLSSGGMIYINGKAGQEVKIIKPIRVALPAKHLEEGMQLFKGEKDENGNINWVSPTPLPNNEQLTSAQQGKVLFQSRCGSCHGIGKDGSGPDLAHFVKRFPTNDKQREEGDVGSRNWWYYEHGQRWVGRELDKNNYDEYAGYSIYKCNLSGMYQQEGPRMFTDTTNGNDLLSIYRYMQNESDRQNLPLPNHAYLDDCIDSCIRYNKIVQGLNRQRTDIATKKDSLTKDNRAMVDEKVEQVAPPATQDTVPTAPVDFDEMVSPKNYQAEYYQFTIESFGWYNVDILLKDINGVQDSDLWVRLTGEYRKKVQVYLIIPSKQVNAEGGPGERSDGEFAFFTKDGKIPLPQAVKAYILALTETDGSLAFALKEFTTSRSQEIEIALNHANKDEFNAAMKKLGLDGLQIKVADAKNADAIRQTDKDIKAIDAEIKNAEGLKPKNCHCNCPINTPAATDAEYNYEINSADLDQ